MNDLINLKSNINTLRTLKEKFHSQPGEPLDGYVEITSKHVFGIITCFLIMGIVYASCLEKKKQNQNKKINDAR
jgi:hypothetical protein